MISKYFNTARTIQEFRSGSIGAYIDGFAKSLDDAGFTRHTIRGHLRAAVHLGRWMDDKDIPLGSLDPGVLKRFRRHLSQCHCDSRSKGVFRRTLPAIEHLLTHLQNLSVLQKKPIIDPPFTDLSKRFNAWMINQTGVSPHTTLKYQKKLIPFLASLGEDPKAYHAAKIRSFVIEQLGKHSPANMKDSTRAIRAFLRFLVAEGLITPGIEHCVPTVPQWRLSSLPRYLDDPDIEKVVASCDTTTAQGLRDHAILLLLVRLGLRAGDVQTMNLDDIDWSRGTLRVFGKSRREDLLPLPQEVGDAVLAYLDSRPKVQSDRIFLTTKAPIRPFIGSQAVSSIVYSALHRAGIKDPPSRGAHLLRHSAATSMLRAGSSLDAIAGILRHKSTDMTAYYAKVDVAMLRLVAQPWVGGPSC